MTMHIGATYAGQNDHKAAVAQFSTALVVGESVTGGWTDKVDCLQAMGTAQVALGDAAALSTYGIALTIWQEKGNRAGEAGVLMLMAQARCMLKQYVRAREDVETALQLRSAHDDRRGMAECYLRLGDVHVAER